MYIFISYLYIVLYKYIVQIICQSKTVRPVQRNSKNRSQVNQYWSMFNNVQHFLSHTAQNILKCHGNDFEHQKYTIHAPKQNVDKEQADLETQSKLAKTKSTT